jgi:hypothetical protein
MVYCTESEIDELDRLRANLGIEEDLQPDRELGEVS